MRIKYPTRLTGLLFSGILLVVAAILLGSLEHTVATAGEKLGKAEKIRRLREQQALNKSSAFIDRKVGRMDNGQLVVRYDNNGLFGNREFTAGIEWPAGSSNFMAWQAGIVFGAVTASGEIISSESYNDVSDNQFNPEPGFDNPSYTNPALGTPIVARSDIAESFPPAWSGRWQSLEEGFINPDILKNLARQETFWVMRDNNDPEASPAIPVGVEIEARMLQINSSLTKDIVFGIFKVTNISGAPLSNCRFGVLVDPDMPAYVGAEFADDDGAFIKDLNLSYARDTDNFYESRPGFNIGYFGTMFLRSPVVDGVELGLTSWALFEYGDMPGAGEFPLTPDGPDPTATPLASRNEAQYQYMTPGLFMKPAFNTDVTYLMAAGDFPLANGESVEMAIAFIGAPDLDALVANANAAQTVFDNNFVGPTPPIPPAVTAVPGNGTVTLYWDDSPSETSIDPLTGRADFEGYRIYRSENKGARDDLGRNTWGIATDNASLYPNGVLPIAEFDVVNLPGDLAGIVVQHSNQVSTAPITSLGLADGSHPGDAAGVDNSTFFSNDNFQIIFDSDSTFQVLNTSSGTLLQYISDISAAVGFAVLDQDYSLLTNNPDATHGVYRSGFPIYITGVFVAITDAAATPDAPASLVATGDVFQVDQRKNDAGKNAGLAHSWTDPEELLNGFEYWYTVAAYDRPDLALGVPINENPPATVADAAADDHTVAVRPQAPLAGFQAATVDSSMVHTSGSSDVAGFELQVIDPRLVTGSQYEISFDTSGPDKTYTVTDMNTSQAVLSDEPFYDAAADNAKMFDGLRLIIVDVTLAINSAASVQAGTPVGGNITLRSSRLQVSGGLRLLQDYEFRFTDAPLTYTDWNTGTPVTANFEVFDISGGGETQITVEIFDNGDGVWQVSERIAIVNTAFTGSGAFEGDFPEDYGWRVRFRTDDPDGAIEAGNVFRVITNKVLTSDDRYQFSTRAEAVLAAQAANDLDLIRVVPNPFVVTSGFDSIRDRHEVHFTRLPETCTIKIFTLAGELVKTIEYDRNTAGVNFALWNLKTEFGSEVAYGVYIYHVSSSVGTKMGKMAVLR